LFEVKDVDALGAAARSGIRNGDYIVSINGEELIDYIDYVYFCSQKKLKIKVRRNGCTLTFRLKKNEDEDIGIIFAQPLLGKKRVCANKCIFCFVDQLPRGMRSSLYLKDEDWRYSFVMGNYVTLSSIEKNELKRILKRRVSPLYISVHTADEALRRLMLGNPNAFAICPLLKKLAAHRIRFHAQAVICPGVNDGDKLEETYLFLRRLYPAAMSLAVVPVGLTAFRQGLHNITPVTKSMAQQTIKTVEKWQKECFNSIGTRFVFAADEYYIKAGISLPAADEYEAYHQIENGVGLVTKFILEAETALKEAKSPGACVSIATGEDMYPFLAGFANKAQQRINGLDVRVYMVKNATFGGGVTVSGLLGGKDFVSALSGRNLGDRLLIPANALRDGEVFLDGMTLLELEESLGVPVLFAEDGCRFVQLLTDTKEE
jgi:putative radical SAM enzyme (TIGR03279 family)